MCNGNCIQCVILLKCAKEKLADKIIYVDTDSIIVEDANDSICKELSAGAEKTKNI